VSGIVLEDQVRVVKQPGDAGAVGMAPVGEMVEKLRGAVAACRGTEIQLRARCDAVALEGVEGAMRRADRYLAAGAHGLFIRGVPTVAGLRGVGRRFGGSHLMIAMFEGRETWLAPAELHAMGFRQVVFPGLLLPRVVDGLDRALRALRAHADGRPPMPPRTHAALQQALQLERWRSIAPSGLV
jgi:2-methylisocitrate lyase-like PEP mutase family enzyme